MRRDVAITGLGAVTPLGPDAASTWQGLLAGRSAIRPITRFDATAFGTTFAAELDAVPTLRGRFADAHDAWTPLDGVDRKTLLLLAAAQEALTQSGVDTARAGVCIGSEGGRKLLEEIGQRTADLGPIVDLRPAVPVLPRGESARMRPSHPTRVLANALGATGPLRTVVTACTSSGGALAEALHLLRSGQAEVVVAGGTDTLVEAFMLSGFSLLGALSTRNELPSAASRPFDLHRDGFVLGEGAGVLVLETAEHARRRGAAVLGWLLGAGMSNNAYRITDSPPDGAGPLLAMSAALRDAQVAPEEVGYVNAHGTSTVMNDLSETRGIRRAFGAHADRLAVSSSKSMIGHLVAACGAVEAVITALSLANGRVHPTAHLQEQDPDCDLDCVPGQPRALPDLRVAISNSFGFGGSNATVVLGKA